MRISSCLYPQRVFNKYTHLYEYVPCGKCESCRNLHTSAWVRRLNDESKCWKYCYFVTLTYADKYLPRFDYTSEQSLFCSSSDEFYSYEDVSSYLDSRSLKILLHRRYLPVLDKSDLQCFFKRLRYYFSYNKVKFKDVQSEKLRYYAVGEYGSTTFRPHYHLLLWFSSDLQASKIEESLLKAWKFGIVDFSPVRSSASSYVASYVNCVANLPSIYKFKPFRQFSICSKCPPIGSLLHSDEEVFKIFYGASCVRPIFDASKTTPSYVSLDPYFEFKLFPKIKGFYDYSHADRVALYGISKFSSTESWEDFQAWFESSCNRFKELAGQYPPSYNIILNDFHRDSFYSPDGLRLCPDAYWQPLKRLFYISSRVCTQCIIFGVSLETYVRQIEYYYDKKSLYHLACQYEFENDYLLENSLSSLVCIDPSFLPRLRDKYRGCGIDSIPDYEIDRLASFGLSVDVLFSDDYPSLDNNLSHLYYASLQRKIARDTVKNKHKNDYLLAHPELSFYK